MQYPSNSDRLDQLKLENDLRDTYLQLLGAQCAVDQLRLRYRPEQIALHGGSFLVARSISAAQTIWEYFSGVQGALKPQAGSPPSLSTGKAEEGSR
jgi:hypothetical protein